MIARRIAIPLLGALLAGCAVGPDYRRPEVDLPGRFAGVVNGEMDGEMDGKAAGKTDAASLASQNWREVFTDTALQKLIDEALTAGPDALLAAARIREAEALAGVSRAPLYPQASVSLNTSPTVRQAGDSQTGAHARRRRRKASRQQQSHAHKPCQQSQSHAPATSCHRRGLVHHLRRSAGQRRDRRRIAIQSHR